MKRLFILIGLAMCAQAQAQQPQLEAHEAWADLTTNELVVRGVHFDNGAALEVLFGSVPLTDVTLTVDSVLGVTEIRASLPVGFDPDNDAGTYTVFITSGGGSIRYDEIHVTVGNTGPQGPKGPPGPKGDPGATGAAGAKGDNGEPGPPGQDGDDCSVAQQLDANSLPSGAKVTCGASVALIPKGDKGDKGNPGAKGDRGEAGLQGPPGKDGADGLTGLAGNDGKDGANCYDSIIGGTSVDDCIGPQGPEGPPGPPGISGLPPNCADGSGIRWDSLQNKWLCSIPIDPQLPVAPELITAEAFRRPNDGNGFFLRVSLVGRDLNADAIGFTFELFSDGGCGLSLTGGEGQSTFPPPNTIDFVFEDEGFIGEVLGGPPASISLKLFDALGLTSNFLCVPVEFVAS